MDVFLHMCTHDTACRASSQHVPAPGPPMAMLGSQSCRQTLKPTILCSQSPWPHWAPSLGPLLPSGCPPLIADVLRDASWRDLNVTQQAARPGARTLWDHTAVSNGVDPCPVALHPHNTLTREPHPVVEAREPGFPEGDHMLKVTCAKRPSRAFAHISQ